MKELTQEIVDRHLQRNFSSSVLYPGMFIHTPVGTYMNIEQAVILSTFGLRCKYTFYTEDCDRMIRIGFSKIKFDKNNLKYPHWEFFNRYIVLQNKTSMYKLHEAFKRMFPFDLPSKKNVILKLKHWAGENSLKIDFKGVFKTSIVVSKVE